MPSDIELIARIALGAILVSAAAIGIPHRLKADRSGGPVPRSVDPPWFWALMILAGPPLMLAYLAYMINPRWLSWSFTPLPDWLRLAGLPLALLALAGFKWMFVHLGHNVTSTSMPRDDAVLVTTGPYRWVRHPMYTVTALLFLAVALLTTSWFIGACGIGVFALLAARSRLEERRLVGMFGDAYRDYRRTTGRFLPRLRRMRAG